MRRLLMIAAMVFVAAIPAKADDAAFKKDVEAIAASYMAAFNKQDAAGIAALYTPDGQLINPVGVHKNVQVALEGMFKSGLDKLEATADQAKLLDPKIGIAQGTFHQTGKAPDGKPLDFQGKWVATYTNDGGKWKIVVLTAVMNPPKPAN